MKGALAHLVWLGHLVTVALESDIFRWGGGLLREGVGAKKFGMFLGGLLAQEKQTFWAGYPGIFAGISWEKFEKKVRSILVP